MILAHQGWDEMIVFAVPILLVLAAVGWAERRRSDDSGDGGNVESTVDGEDES